LYIKNYIGIGAFSFKMIEIIKQFTNEEIIWGLIYERAPHGFWICNLEDIQENWVSPLFLNVLGYNKEIELESKSVFNDFINQDDFKKLIEAQILGEISQIRVRYTTVNRSEISLNCHATVLRKEEKKWLIAAHRFDDYFHPIRHQETLLSDVISNIQDILYTLDTQQQHTAVFGKWMEKMNIGPDYFIGKTARDLFGDEYAKPHIEANSRALKGEYVEYVWEIESPDGKKVFNTSLSPIFDEYGNVNGIVGIGKDITKLFESDDKIARSSEMLTKLTNQMPGVVYQFQLYDDGRMCFPFASSGMKEIFGYTPEDVKNNAKLVFDLVHPDDIEEVYKETYASAKNLTQFNCEFRVVLPDLGVKWCLSDASPEKMEDGSVLWYGIITDITKRKEAEEKLLENKKRLEAFLEISQKITTADLSHDVMQLIVDSAMEVSKVGTGAIYLLDKGNQKVNLIATSPSLPDHFPEHLRRANFNEHPRLAEVFRTEKYVIIPDTRAVELTEAERLIVDIRNLRSNLYLPIKHREKVFGVLILCSIEHLYEFTFEEIRLLQGFADQAAQLIHISNNHQELLAYAEKLENEIREKNIAREKLFESEQLLTEAQRVSKIGNWNFDFRNDRLTWSEGLYDVFDIDRETFKETHGSFLSLIDDEYKDLVIQTSKKTQETGEPFNIVYKITTLKGEKRYIEEYGFAEKDTSGKIIRLYGTSQDVTKQKLFELELRRLSTAVEQSPVSIVITDVRGNIRYVNPYFSELTGYSFLEAIGENPRILRSGYQSDEYYEVLWKTITAGKVWRGELQNIKKNGETYWESASITPIFDDRGNITNFLAVKEDITERKQAEEEISRNLQEKSVLLAEVHHRVKNNMAIMYSLLGLQTEFSTFSNETTSVIKELQSRIRSMGIVHELVYQNDVFSEICLKSIVEKISLHLESIYKTTDSDIHTVVHVEDIPLDLNLTVPFSLLINEILTNKWKHSFEGRTSGLIEIKITKVNQSLELIIQDDGLPVPDLMKLRNPESYGYTIIHGLVSQLDGNIDFENIDKGGLSVKIQLPVFSRGE